jgi:hypothetical protein
MMHMLVPVCHTRMHGSASAAPRHSGSASALGRQAGCCRAAAGGRSRAAPPRRMPPRPPRPTRPGWRTPPCACCACSRWTASATLCPTRRAEPQRRGPQPHRRARENAAAAVRLFTLFEDLSSHAKRCRATRDASCVRGSRLGTALRAASVAAHVWRGALHAGCVGSLAGMHLLPAGGDAGAWNSHAGAERGACGSLSPFERWPRWPPGRQRAPYSPGSIGRVGLGHRDESVPRAPTPGSHPERSAARGRSWRRSARRPRRRWARRYGRCRAQACARRWPRWPRWRPARRGRRATAGCWAPSTCWRRARTPRASCCRSRCPPRCAACRCLPVVLQQIVVALPHRCCTTITADRRCAAK